MLAISGAATIAAKEHLAATAIGVNDSLNRLGNTWGQVLGQPLFQAGALLELCDYLLLYSLVYAITPC